jgi:glucose/mannose-6-phosphate isomerase
LVAPDTLGLARSAAAAPDQVARAVAATGQVLSGSDVLLPAHQDIEHVVVLGAGDSGAAGDAVRVVAGPLMAVPIVVHKGYGLPNFVDRHSLVVAVSFSGHTEETLESAGQAVEAGASVVAVTVDDGNPLVALARQVSAPVVGIDADLPTPASAFAPMTVAPLVVLEHLGLYPGGEAWIAAAVEALRRRARQLAQPDNVAERLARRIGRQIPIIYGGGDLGAVAARRWKTQFNLNAKAAAFSNGHPDLDHHELSGWGQNGDVTRQIFRLVNLRHDYEHPQTARRFALTDEVMAEVVGGIDEVVAQGDGPLAQLLDLALVGDRMSLCRAAQEGLDPGPVPVVDDLERRLAN